MTVDNTQISKFMIENYISKDVEELLSGLEHKYKKKFIDYFVKNNIDSWASCYSNIKDHSWPPCTSCQDFYNLPDYIQQECITQHKFSPEIFLNDLKKRAGTKFDAIHATEIQTQKPELEQFLFDNIHVVKNKKIIDFACNAGRWSFFSVLNGCKQVIGVDVRDDNIAIANTIKNSSVDFGKNINFAQSDIHNIDNNQKLCQHQDTVFLFGIMYHVHNHTKIIQSVCQSSVKHVVIESRIVESTKPTVEWVVDYDHNRKTGWDSDQYEIMVGVPSTMFFDFVFEKLGFKKSKEHCYVRKHPDAPDELRALLLYQRQ